MSAELPKAIARVRDRLEHAVDRPIDDGEFEELAVSLWRSQAAALPLLRAPTTGLVAPTRLWDLPTIPTRAFKEWNLCPHPEEEVTRAFVSSGTTQASRSVHRHTEQSLAVYHLATLQGFRVFFESQAPRRLISLCPPSTQANTSSLAEMFSLWIATFGDHASQSLGALDAEANWQLDPDRLWLALDEAIASQTPVLLLGAAFHFVWILDALREPIGLPTGSILLETGGYKGRSRVLERDRLHRELATAFQLPPSAIVSEYGMSELSSQAYATFGADGGVFQFPSWVRARAICPETGCPVNDGETGILELVDLANVASSVAIQTQDLARPRSGGFEILGRAPEAESKGCSLFVST